MAGKLRAISWDYAYYGAASATIFMLLITIFFYSEPKREIEGVRLSQKIMDIKAVFADFRFSIFLVLLGVGYWMPFWAFFNLCALYADSSLDAVRLFEGLQFVFGPTLATALFGHTDANGTTRMLGETLSHTGYFVIVLQVFVSRILERFRAIPSFLFGLCLAGVGFFVIGLAALTTPTILFAGIFLFAVGEMITSPRIQEYIVWIAPKEKAGLYMGTNFLAVGLGGAMSGVVYTSLYGSFQAQNHPEYVWFVLAGHMLLTFIILGLYTATIGKFHEQES